MGKFENEGHNFVSENHRMYAAQLTDCIFYLHKNLFVMPPPPNLSTADVFYIFILMSESLLEFVSAF